MLKAILFLTLSSIFATVQCISIAGKGLCDFNDELCVTKAEKSVFKTIVAGNQLWAMESSDPLRVPTININLSYNMDYTFTDVYLYGMTDCDNHKLKFDKDSSWYFYLICPRLILKADYIEKGSIDSVAVEGKGKITITYDTYHIVTKGAVETITGSDGKPHMNVTYFEIAELDAKGDVAFDFRNMCTNDLEKSEKAHEYINDNWKQMNDVIQYPIMQSVLIKFFNNLNKYLDAVPKYEIFYKDL